MKTNKKPYIISLITPQGIIKRTLYAESKEKARVLAEILGGPGVIDEIKPDGWCIDLIAKEELNKDIFKQLKELEKMKELNQGDVYIIDGLYGPTKIKVLEVTNLTYLIKDLDSANSQATRWTKKAFKDKFIILEELCVSEKGVTVEEFKNSRPTDMYY